MTPVAGQWVFHNAQNYYKCLAALIISAATIIIPASIITYLSIKIEDSEKEIAEKKEELSRLRLRKLIADR